MPRSSFLLLLLPFGSLLSCATAPEGQERTGTIHCGLIVGDENTPAEDLPPYLSLEFIPHGGETLIVAPPTSLPVGQIEVQPEGDGGLYRLSFEFSPEAKARLETWDPDPDPRRVALFVDREAVAVPLLKDVLAGPVEVGGLRALEAKLLAAELRGSPLLPGTSIELRPVLPPGPPSGLADTVQLTVGGRPLVFDSGTSFALRWVKVLENDGRVYLMFEIVEGARAAFEQWTGRHVGREVGVFFEAELIAGPFMINTPLPGGGFLAGPGIDGWTLDEAWALHGRLWGSLAE